MLTLKDLTFCRCYYFSMHLLKLALLVFSFIPLFSFGRPIQIVTEHLPPFQIAHADGSVGGSVTELVRKVFEHAKIPHQISSNEWSVSYELAQKSANVCIYSIVKTPERTALFQWVGKVGKEEGHFYSIAARDIRLFNLEDAKKYTIAAQIKDASYHIMLGNGFVPGKNLFPLHLRDNIVTILTRRSDTIDLVILTPTMYERQVSENDEGLLKRHTELAAISFEAYLACSLNTSVDTVQTLKTAMQEVNQQ